MLRVGDVLRRQRSARFGRGPAAARVLGLVIDGAVFAGSRLPVRVAHALAVVGGHAEWIARPSTRRLLAVNIGHGIGMPPSSARVRGLVRRELVNEARRSADLLWAIGRPEELLATLEVDGMHHVNDIVATGRGVVLASLHIGGWEVVGAVPAAMINVPATVVVADNWLAWAMQHVRRAEGLRMIYRSSPLLNAVRLLRRGEVLLVLGEDATGAPPRRHLVRFGDSAAHLPAGVVSLARLADAAIVPFHVLPLGPRRWRAVIESAIEPPRREDGTDGEAAALQLLADRWSSLIAAHPQHWAARFPIDWEEG
ncbi:MAG TPA: lysophospholipid acyltransferase family protein [Ilumatobacteraceae bacterium]|nr:lysophospholipid acyltransferase family protein [Ilumatobacteraceae bacterium]